MQLIEAQERGLRIFLISVSGICFMRLSEISDYELALSFDCKMSWFKFKEAKTGLASTLGWGSPEIN